MKKLAIFLGGLLMMPAFAEVAPIFYEDAMEYSDAEYADEYDAIAGEDDYEDTENVSVIKTVPVRQITPSTRTNTNRTTVGRVVPTTPVPTSSGRTASANASRAIAARTTSVSSPRNSGNSRNVASRTTTSRVVSGAGSARTTATRATGGAGRYVSATRAGANGTIARTATSGRATSANGARVSRAATTSGTTNLVQTDTTYTSLYNPNSARVSIRGDASATASRVPVIRVASTSGLSTDSVSTATSVSDMDELAELTDYCKAQYAACMDNYCNVLDDNQGRCSCSANLANYAKAEAALKSATEELQDVAQKMTYIGLSARQVETLFTQTEAELKMQSTADNSQLKTSLDKIKDMIIDVQSGGASSSATSGLAFDLSGLLDFTIDSTGFDLTSFIGGFTNNTTGVSNQRGEELFKTATNQCKANVLRSCTAAGVDASIVTNAYDLEIDKECIAYERSLNDSNAQMTATVRNAKSVLQRARLVVEQAKNEYKDMRSCINELDSCMQDEYVCGTDYEKCLDPSGRYIVNGAIVVGTDPGRAVNNISDGSAGVLDGDICSMNLYNIWNYGTNSPAGQTVAGCTNAWGDGDLAKYIEETVTATAAKNGGLGVSEFIQNKIGWNDGDKNYGMCISVLNKCQDYTYTGTGTSRKYNPQNDVVKQYLARTLVQIKARQDQILADYAESCITDVTSCLSQNNYPFDEVSDNTVQANIAINACRSQIVTCMSVNGYSVANPRPSDLSLWVCGITGQPGCTGYDGGQTCTMTYDCNSSAGGTGTPPSSQTVNVGSNIVVSGVGSCHTSNGKTFSGWLVGAPNSTTVWEAGSTHSCLDRTLYANWVSGSGGTHSITWNTQESSAPITNCDTSYSTSSTVQYKYCTPGNVSGKTFKGWCTNAAGTQGCDQSTNISRATIPANSSSNITFYAQWDNASPQWLQVTLDDNGGSGSSPNPIYYQSVSGISACPQGWYDDRVCNVDSKWNALEEGVPVRAGCDYRGHFITTDDQEVVNDHGVFSTSFNPSGYNSSIRITAKAKWVGCSGGDENPGGNGSESEDAPVENKDTQDNES